METSAFLEFIRLVVAGDIERVSHRLSAAPSHFITRRTGDGSRRRGPA